MNRPVQVMLDPEDRRRARRRAAEDGLTLAGYVRRLVQADLESWTPGVDVAVAIDIDDSGETADDAALEIHPDQSLGEAVAARLDKTNPPTA